MDEAMKPLLDEYIKMGSMKFFDKYDSMSLRYYLANFAKPKPWYHAKINYVEVRTAWYKRIHLRCRGKCH